MPQWLITLLIFAGSLLISGGGLYIALRVALVELKGEARELRVLVAKLEQWQKDKDHFDYEFRHTEYNTAISGINSQVWPLIQQVNTLDRSLTELREWKHEVGDAYLPRAVDEHERRINRLDARVFNGGTK